MWSSSETCELSLFDVRYFTLLLVCGEHKIDWVSILEECIQCLEKFKVSYMLHHTWESGSRTLLLWLKLCSKSEKKISVVHLKKASKQISQVKNEQSVIGVEEASTSQREMSEHFHFSPKVIDNDSTWTWFIRHSLLIVLRNVRWVSTLTMRQHWWSIGGECFSSCIRQNWKWTHFTIVFVLLPRAPKAMWNSDAYSRSLCIHRFSSSHISPLTRKPRWRDEISFLSIEKHTPHTGVWCDDVKSESLVFRGKLKIQKCLLVSAENLWAREFIYEITRNHRGNVRRCWKTIAIIWCLFSQ